MKAGRGGKRQASGLRGTDWVRDARKYGHVGGREPSGPPINGAGRSGPGGTKDMAIVHGTRGSGHVARTEVQARGAWRSWRPGVGCTAPRGAHADVRTRGHKGAGGRARDAWVAATWRAESLLGHQGKVEMSTCAG